MADATEATVLQHEHEHFGSVHARLIVTFVGGVLILNAYLLGYFLAPDQEEIAAISAMIGALILGTPILIGGFQEMRQGRMHMSALVAIAVLAAFVLADYRVAGIVAFFMLLASLIEQKTAEGAVQSIERLMRLTPKTAELASGETVQVSELRPGLVLAIRPGDTIPADGKLIKGETTVNEATITGESLPADKSPGDELFAGTDNLTAYVEMEVTRAGEDTTLGKVKHLILQAAKTKTPIMQLIDRYAEWYTPGVLMIAAIIWVFTKDSPDPWERVITALVVCCPCAFVLATPTAMVAGLSAAARLGILVKDVAHLETAGDISAVVFDKTGTLTTGQLTVTRMSPVEGVDGVELLEAAASLEQHSRHPIAKAVVEIARRANILFKTPANMEEAAGKGVRGVIADRQIMVGRRTWLEEAGVDLGPVDTSTHADDSSGLSLLYVARDGTCIGWLGLEDRARPQARDATSALASLGIKRITMLTGDRWSVAKRIAGELGCTEVQAECLPEQKLQLVEHMQSEGHRVAVVGDGVNDAPALAAGDLGIAMGAAGSDVAINSASIALMSNELDRLPFLVRLSRKLRSVIIQNLSFGAIFVIGGLLLSAFGYLTPITAALLHNVSSFIVIFNSARLVRFGEHLTPYEGAAAAESQPSPAAA